MRFGAFEYFRGLDPNLTPEAFYRMRKGPGVTVNAGNLSEYRRRFGSNPPPNHVWTGETRTNADGHEVPILAKVGPAADKARQAEAKATAAGEAQQRTAGLVTKHADRVRSLIRDSWLPVTGPAGAALANIPGTGAHDAGKLLDSIKAIASFDSLQKMRAASPTGGALGSVSNVELGFLQSAIASLEQSQSEAQFLENLATVENAFRAVIHGPNAPGNRAGGAEDAGPRDYMTGGGADRVMQSLGLGGAPNLPGPAIPAAPEAGGVPPTATVRPADFERETRVQARAAGLDPGPYMSGRRDGIGTRARRDGDTPADTRAGPPVRSRAGRHGRRVRGWRAGPRPRARLSPHERRRPDRRDAADPGRPRRQDGGA